MGEGAYLACGGDLELRRDYWSRSGSASAPTRRGQGPRAWRQPAELTGWVGPGPLGTGQRGLSLPQAAPGPGHSGRRLPFSSHPPLGLDPSLRPSPPPAGAEKPG